MRADVGGNLLIESLQDTSTFESQQKSMSASVTIGAGAGGSFSSSKSNVNSDYASVVEQSGLRAGDGGFQVNVGGNTALIGGAITSNQSAVEGGKNRFNTGGELTTTDIQNTASYSGNSASVGVGGGNDSKNKGISGVGVGVGSDKGDASSVTKAGISGIAGDTTLRSTDAETGIARIFDKETVQKEINAQTKITEVFSREAPKAVASYATSQERALTAQLDAETDPDKKAALAGEIDKWKEGGTYRVALHTAAGALGGGASGAAGAAVSGASANVMNALQDSLQQGLESAGLGDTVAKGIAQGIATLTAAGVSAAVGGTYGAASAATVDANNRQLHLPERRLAQELAKKSNGKYSAEQVEEQMRLMGNKAFVYAQANKTEVLTTPEAIATSLEQDPGMPKLSDGKTVIEIPGLANVELQQYIIGNSTYGAGYIPGQSPYVASNASLNPASTPYSPSNTTSAARCANGDLACISGVGQQQNAPLTQQAREAIADTAAVTSRGAGVIAAGATAVAAGASPQVKPIASGVALGSTGVGVLADAVNYLANPDPKRFIKEQIGVGFPASVLAERYPLWAPIINEVAEELKKP